jgi:hypothetical protein
MLLCKNLKKNLPKIPKFYIFHKKKGMNKEFPINIKLSDETLREERGIPVKKFRISSNFYYIDYDESDQDPLLLLE